MIRGIRADPAVVEHLLGTIDAGGWDVGRVVPYILHWAALNPPIRPGLEDPFEPLILLFERDGGFHTENGEVNLEWLSVRMGNWRDRADDPPLAGLSPDALDGIDRAGSIAQFGYVMDRSEQA